MDAEEFVKSLKMECRDAAVRDCVANYTSPPGRRPMPALLELSRWFNALSEHDREMVKRAMADAADATLFGILCVLDGVRSVEKAPEKSVFRLVAEKAGHQSVICPGPTDLHDL